MRFLIARDPDPDSTLPYLVRLPIDGGLILKVRDTWPRTARVFCARAEAWPSEAEVDIVEDVAVLLCRRRGPAIDLVLDRGREDRSQFVVTTMRGGRDNNGTLVFELSKLGETPRAAIVVEDRYSALLKHAYAPAGFLPDMLARVQVRYPEIPIVFAETRPLAEEWTFRYLGAAAAEDSGA